MHLLKFLLKTGILNFSSMNLGVVLTEISLIKNQFKNPFP